MSETRNDVERNWGEHSPSYYRAMAIQPTDYIVANKLEYLPASIVKYASRAGRKPGEPALKDAKKCLAFAKRWVAELEAVAAEQRRSGPGYWSDGQQESTSEGESRQYDTRAVAQSCTAPKAG